jgi:hypothetical protein
MYMPKAIVAALTGILLFAGAVQGADVPTYNDGVLTIPSVSTDNQVGQYQNAVLQLNAQGVWQLTSVNVLGGFPALYLVPISQVEVVKIVGVPVQVFLRASGSFTNGCGSLGRITQRLVGNRFEIVMADGFTQYALAFCAAVIVPYVKTIPLPVYGLGAGIYTYNINGMTGTFELTSNNTLSGDCFGSAACQSQIKVGTFAGP